VSDPWQIVFPLVAFAVVARRAWQTSRPSVAQCCRWLAVGKRGRGVHSPRTSKPGALREPALDSGSSRPACLKHVARFGRTITSSSIPTACSSSARTIGVFPCANGVQNCLQPIQSLRAGSVARSYPASPACSKRYLAMGLHRATRQWTLLHRSWP